eukprot:gene8276-1545_t
MSPAGMRQQIKGLQSGNHRELHGDQPSSVLIYPQWVLRSTPLKAEGLANKLRASYDGRRLAKGRGVQKAVRRVLPITSRA